MDILDTYSFCVAMTCTNERETNVQAQDMNAIATCMKQFKSNNTSSKIQSNFILWWQIINLWENSSNYLPTIVSELTSLTNSDLTLKKASKGCRSPSRRSGTSTKISLPNDSETSRILFQNQKSYGFIFLCHFISTAS